MFLEISKNSQDYNFIKKEALAQEVSCEFYEISKNNFIYRTTPVAACMINDVNYHLSYF